VLTTENLRTEVPRLASTLPPFPKIVAQLLDELRDPAASMESLIRLARNDPVITSNILATANKMRRLHVQPDLHDPFVAAALIGIDQIRRIVATVGMNRFLEHDKGSSFLLAHSRAVAIVAQELAMLTGVAPEKAYIAAILHDVGQLCFHRLDADAFQEIYRQSAIDGRLLEREASTFGVDHTQIGAALAEYWLLPEDFVSTILTHHDDRIVTSKLQAAINISESLARALDIPASPKNRLTRLNQPAVDALGIVWDSPVMRDFFGRCRARFLQALH
jgi:putative nucleotidyltransferase with HDIG domain